MFQSESKQLLIGAPEYIMRPLDYPPCLLIVPGIGVLLAGVAEYTYDEIRAMKFYDRMTRLDFFIIMLPVIVAIQVMFADMGIAVKLFVVISLAIASQAVARFVKAYYRSLKRRHIVELWERLVSFREVISAEVLNEFLFELRLKAGGQFDSFDPHAECVSIAKGISLAVNDKRFKPAAVHCIAGLYEHASGVKHPEDIESSQLELLYEIRDISSKLITEEANKEKE